MWERNGDEVVSTLGREVVECERNGDGGGMGGCIW